MANIKITGMSGASTPLAGTELLELVQGGNSVSVAAKDVARSFITSASNVMPVANGGTGATTLTGYVKGSGTSAMTASSTIPFADIAGRAYAEFCDTTDQTGNTGAATAVKLNTTNISQGVTVANDGGGNPTWITFAAAGTYYVVPSLQFANSASSDYNVTVWLALNGTRIANSATNITVPKLADGGSGFFASPFVVTVTAGQYVQVMWLPANTAVTIEYTAAGAIAPAVPSAIVAVQRIA